MRTPSNLHLHELIGLEAEIINSSSRNLLGLRGKVVDETKNMLTLEAKGREIKVQKIANEFLFFLENGEKVKIRGKDILFRPEERTKKAL